MKKSFLAQNVILLLFLPGYKFIESNTYSKRFGDTKNRFSVNILKQLNENFLDMLEKHVSAYGMLSEERWARMMGIIVMWYFLE